MKTVFTETQMHGSIMDLLTELEEYFEPLQDCNDGAEGIADQPNEEMRFMLKIDALKQCAKEIE